MPCIIIFCIFLTIFALSSCTLFSLINNFVYYILYNNKLFQSIKHFLYFYAYILFFNLFILLFYFTVSFEFSLIVYACYQFFLRILHKSFKYFWLFLIIFIILFLILPSSYLLAYFLFISSSIPFSLLLSWYFKMFPLGMLLLKL